MITEKNKATRIIKEITGYFLSKQICSFEIDIEMQKTRLELTFTFDKADEPSNFDRFVADLNTPRQYELEEHFNSLLGSHTHYEDYSFLGRSVDKASVKEDNEKIHLIVHREILR